MENKLDNSTHHRLQNLHTEFKMNQAIFWHVGNCLRVGGGTSEKVHKF